MTPAGNADQRSSLARLRDSIANRARAVPIARHAWARYRRRRYERQIQGFLRAKGNFDSQVGPAWWGTRIWEPKA